MMKKLLAILLCLSLILALAACSKPESQTQQPAQAEDQPTEPTQAEQPSEPEALTYPIEQFTVGTTAVIETAVFGEYNFDMLASGVSELPLVWQDAEGNYHPLLASYETEDSVTWVYTIEPGMTWSDGEPVTAEVLAQRQAEEAIRRETERRADEIVRKMAENKPDLPDGKTEQAVREIAGQERDRTATSEREAALPESVLRESQREREAVREVARENLLQERLQQMERDMVRDLQKEKTLGGD